jgi:orotate phosphoribosyltransferase
MPTDDRATALQLLAEYAYSFKPGGFTLVSCQRSDEYLDCKMALSQPTSAAPLGNLFLSCVDPLAVAIGGLTMGADPIAMNVSTSSAATKQPLRWFSVRKDANLTAAVTYRTVRDSVDALHHRLLRENG